ncbi:UPF0449 protein C19orf25 homolog [Bacillus rossius redtenbacheri]|uniref:UPF0449 protein C19orf25 homolog n=1 Tax=Bacillus rossius redtenbacheri TaxID=93214 RepID=UPI002FDDDD05
MMFKKKPNIPPRPKPPLIEHIIEDIKNAPHDDVAFAVGEEEINTPSRSGNKDASQASDQDNPEATFQKMKIFIEVNRDLKEMIVKLEAQNEELKEADVKLKNIAEDIRRQASEALKECG